MHRRLKKDKRFTLYRFNNQKNNEYYAKLSKKQYNNVLSEKCFLENIEDELFPDILYQQLAIKGEINTFLSIIKNSKDGILLIGNSGIGKTSYFIKLWGKLLDSDNILPLYIPLIKFNFSKDMHFIHNYILDNYSVDYKIYRYVSNAIFRWNQ